MKAIEQYFPVVLFITLYKLVVTFETVDKILRLTNQMKDKILKYTNQMKDIEH